MKSSWIIELTDAAVPFRFLAAGADGLRYWASKLDEALTFPDRPTAEKFIDRHLSGNVRAAFV